MSTKESWVTDAAADLKYTKDEFLYQNTITSTFSHRNLNPKFHSPIRPSTIIHHAVHRRSHCHHGFCQQRPRRRSMASRQRVSCAFSHETSSNWGQSMVRMLERSYCLRHRYQVHLSPRKPNWCRLQLDSQHSSHG